MSLVSIHCPSMKRFFGHAFLSTKDLRQNIPTWIRTSIIVDRNFASKEGSSVSKIQSSIDDGIESADRAYFGNNSTQFCTRNGTRFTDRMLNLSTRNGKRRSDEEQHRFTTLSPLAMSLQTHVMELLSKQSANLQPHSPTKAVHLHLVVSVSGGCDSVALLHACMEWKQAMPSLLQRRPHVPSSTPILHVHVVHFHHRQRPIDADLDYQFVKSLVQHYNQQQQQQQQQQNGTTTLIDTFHMEDWKDADTKQTDTVSDDTFSQDKARQWRRTKLLEFAQTKVDPPTASLGMILTAHHRDDHYESALLKLLRGVHLLNWKGMEPVTVLTTAATSDNVPSHQQSSIYLVRPFLDLSKQDLVDYLLQRGLIWREDVSNASNKYLRNRVRSELIPLLLEMTDGAFLDKRLSNLLRQSQELSTDMSIRIEEYVQRNQPDAICDGGFWRIPEKQLDASSTLVYSQALLRWMTQQMKALRRFGQDDSDTDVMIPYETLQRVMKQLQQYPDRKQWELELGGNYSLVRQGETLRVECSSFSESIGYLKGKRKENAWKWTVAPDTTTATTVSSNLDSVDVFLSRGMVHGDLSFYSTTLAEATSNNEPGDDRAKSLTLVPPWRNSPVKIRQFLRGQDVPVHERDNTSILFAKSNPTSEPKVIAIQVNQRKWVVNKQYNGETIKDIGAIDDSIRVQVTSCRNENDT
ncbi:tRNAIle-lysidine synthetase [Nitzschia inconspicua]|uniref:tRNA(Ile)-lysidine synthetase n=1 Tax=Nitzschia inconspicua TaxID=303405 RepID=A0A9K3PFX3_9STRA|nr:tRNAIle-lysidine synthetase [Nitzschia inconspicua]